MQQFLHGEALEDSPVVANCNMNRERDLLGRSGYEYEIGFNPLEFISAKASSRGAAAWLDLCCGSGRALAHLRRRRRPSRAELHRPTSCELSLRSTLKSSESRAARGFDRQHAFYKDVLAADMGGAGVPCLRDFGSCCPGGLGSGERARTQQLSRSGLSSFD